jgi:hypothetical protein
LGVIIGQDSRENINRRSQIIGRGEGTWPNTLSLAPGESSGVFLHRAIFTLR